MTTGGIVDKGFKTGLSVVTEGETKGVFGGEGGGKDLKAKEDSKGFDLHSKSYAGPGNLEFKPDNKGTKNPDDIKHQ